LIAAMRRSSSEREEPGVEASSTRTSKSRSTSGASTRGIVIAPILP
jgi:hypothetical protein